MWQEESGNPAFDKKKLGTGSFKSGRDTFGSSAFENRVDLLSFFNSRKSDWKINEKNLG
jgi:hypothetical protein